MFPLLIDIDEGQLGLVGGIHVATTGDHQIGLLLVGDIQQLTGISLVEQDGILPHQLADASLVLLGGLAGATGHHHHPQILQRRDHGPGFHPAGVEQHALAAQPRTELGQLRLDPRLFAGNQRLGAHLQIGILQTGGYGAQRLRHVAHAIETPLEPGGAMLLLQLARHVDQGPRADQHVQLAAVHGLHLGKTGVARQGAEHPHPQLIEQRQDIPEFAGNVVLANQRHAVAPLGRKWGIRGPGRRFATADHLLDHQVAGDAVAQILAAIKTGGIDGDHGHADPLGRQTADGLDIVPFHGRHAGVVDEDGRRMVLRHQLTDAVKQTSLAAPHDHILLAQIGGEAQTKQLGPRAMGAPVVPGATDTTDGAMHHMGHIGDGQQGDLRPIEGTAPGGSPRFTDAATRFRLAVVWTGGLVHQHRNLASFHRHNGLL